MYFHFRIYFIRLDRSLTLMTHSLNMAFSCHLRDYLFFSHFPYNSFSGFSTGYPWHSLCGIPNYFRPSVAFSDSSLKKIHWDAHHSIIYKIPPTNDTASSLGTTSCLSVSKRYWLSCLQTSILPVTKATRSSSTMAWMDWNCGGCNFPRDCLEGLRELTS